MPAMGESVRAGSDGTMDASGGVGCQVQRVRDGVGAVYLSFYLCRSLIDMVIVIGACGVVYTCALWWCGYSIVCVELSLSRTGGT